MLKVLSLPGEIGGRLKPLKEPREVISVLTSADLVESPFAEELAVIKFLIGDSGAANSIAVLPFNSLDN